MGPVSRAKAEVSDVSANGLPARAAAIQDAGARVMFGLMDTRRMLGSYDRIVWRDGLIASVTNYLDTDEALAGAERLAVKRG